MYARVFREAWEGDGRGGAPGGEVLHPVRLDRCARVRGGAGPMFEVVDRETGEVRDVMVSAVGPVARRYRKKTMAGMANGRLTARVIRASSDQE